ncbi:MAG TPA: hypothetical protein VGK19_22430 [Capsulimonadaceae bacterium]
MATDHQKQLLTLAYEDPLLSSHDREHAFYGFWSCHRKAFTYINRNDLTEILTHTDWLAAVSSLLSDIIMSGQVSVNDLDWLRQQMVEAKLEGWHSLDQLDALVVYNDGSISHVNKLACTLSKRADWLSYPIIATAPSDVLQDLLALVAESRRPRSARNNLRDAILSRMDAKE